LRRSCTRQTSFSIIHSDEFTKKMPNPPIPANLVYNLSMRESVRLQINNGAQNQDTKSGPFAAVFVYVGLVILGQLCIGGWAD